jgi:hypothetical protein
VPRHREPTFASAVALLESDSVQTATCLLLDVHLEEISGIELQRRLTASGSKCPVHLHDRGRRQGHAQLGDGRRVHCLFAQAVRTACLAERHFESRGLAGAARSRTRGVVRLESIASLSPSADYFRSSSDCVAKLSLRRLTIRDSVGGEGISGSSA